MKIPDCSRSGEMSLYDVLRASMALQTQVRGRYSFIVTCASASYLCRIGADNSLVLPVLILIGQRLGASRSNFFKHATA